jgi:hypothetical protein
MEALSWDFLALAAPKTVIWASGTTKYLEGL